MTHARIQGCFRNVVVLDFEYEVEAGSLPHVLCLVVHVLDANLRHMRTIRLWRGEFGATPPFPIDDDTLVAGYSLWADLMCFPQLGWRFPVHVYDAHTAYLSVSNILLPYEPDETRKKSRKGLSYACAAYGIEGWEKIDKPEMARAIGEGRWREYGQPAVFEYCEIDVSRTAELVRRQLVGYRDFAPVDPQRVMNWSTYSAKSVARIQAHGMLIDMPLWNLVQENKARVGEALIARLDPSQSAYPSYYKGEHCPIYIDGEFSSWRFEYWLQSVGINAWPRLASGALELEGDAFRLMGSCYASSTDPRLRPLGEAIENLYALREALGVIVRARIPIGPDGRNRPSLFPFGTATGRNAHAKSLFNAHAGMRSFLVGPVEKILVYLDWRTQEVGIAAARSSDAQLAADYSAGDIYYALAKLCGLTDDPDIKRWKKDNADQRQRMKSLQLGVNYGMGVRSLARGLGRHPLIGSEVLIRHQQRYPTFWAWRQNMVDCAMLDRAMESEFDGWPLHLSTSPNRRTLFNFPMQSGGAEMLRLAANRLCDAGLVPSMLVHDGILFELDNMEQVAHAKEIMLKAGTEVCGGLEIGVDADPPLIGGKRFRDKRAVAQRMWAVVMDTLQEIGAISAKAG